MAHTLLELTKSILNSMDGDEIASINDTVESRSIVSVIKDSYEFMASHTTFPEHKGFFQLEASTYGDMALQLPERVVSVAWIKYDHKLSTDTVVRYENLKQYSLRDFIDYTSHLSAENSNTFPYIYDDGITTLQLLATNDAFPYRYTLVNDRVVLFDSFWQEEEGALDPSRTLAYGTLSQSFLEDDNFILPLDEGQYTLLKNEAKSQAFFELKQTANPKAEQRARQGWIDTQHTKYTKDLPPLSRVPDYGRK